ncbi:ribosome recycling factor [Apilactobacillus micheneri]|uniref:Ribosome-recycling factor n=1 Tax=Apilactobacillus micheneri TaxID=1899430 RepID=A0ABY2YYI0_9LACO|nr:ribosome recycling factor [Apilactobacillus micheneri]TPR25676.1 ribosome recycling factor [Apilactobacillus micheneri]TPR26780.1 ribosome recycling factor [Apilactobacillus micheneri]TPR28568.1 ribosome recycling factor [Apilactobacillus micheneri]TPR29255.1 ribosome recycling factor [Apilactobacillus micheneri]TPR30843.1 ribosome recycling factor [Apilactobacillus micheneri]
MVTSKEVLDNAKSKMQKTTEALKHDLGGIRAGRANPSLLSGVTVDYYGATTPLNQIAAITVPEARVIMVSPYDKSALNNIEKGILEADLGINPANDGDKIRMVIPQLTEERRSEVSKKVKATGESNKVAIRNVRREAMDAVKKGNKSDDFNDDEAHRLEDQVQQLTDKEIKHVDQIVSDKENEVMNG